MCVADKINSKKIPNEGVPEKVIFDSDRSTTTRSNAETSKIKGLPQLKRGRCKGTASKSTTEQVQNRILSQTATVYLKILPTKIKGAWQKPDTTALLSTTTAYDYPSTLAHADAHC